MSVARLIRLLLAFAVLLLAGWLVRGYTTDDTFIHLRYAHHLLERGEFSFNPGQNSYGATSPLWIFGLALFMKLGLAPAAAAWWLGALSGLSMILVLDAFLSRMTFPVFWKGALLVVAAADVWFLRWTFSGMETPLITTLLLALLWPLVSGRKGLGWGQTREHLWLRYLGWGVTAGLTGLVRPEFLLVAPLALPWLLWFEYFRAGAVGGQSGRHLARPHKPLLGAIAGWGLVVGPWLLFAWLSFGRILPGTAAAKSSEAAFAPLDFIYHAVGTMRYLAATQGFLWLGAFLLIILVLVRNSSESERLPGRWPDESAVRHGESGKAPGEGPWSVWGPVALMGIAVTWLTVLVGGYALKDVYVISRYISPLGPVLLLALALVVEWLANGPGITHWDRRLAKGLIAVSVLATLLANTWIFTSRVLPHTRSFPAGVKECYIGMGEWLRDNTPPEAVVAALDIGAVGYASERRVLDLMGLVSPEILAVGQVEGFQAMVESGSWLKVIEQGSGRRADYFVDRSQGPPRWTDRELHGVRFELLDTCIIEGVGLREPGPWTVALYRLVSVDSRVNSSAGG